MCFHSPSLHLSYISTAFPWREGDAGENLKAYCYVLEIKFFVGLFFQIKKIKMGKYDMIIKKMKNRSKCKVIVTTKKCLKHNH
jgi:hypothetical protein